MWRTLKHLRHHLGLGLPKRVPVKRQGRYHIRGVTVINPAHSRHQRATIAVAEDSIEAIQLDDAPGAAHHAADDVMHTGHYALPGLVDMHVHLPPANGLKLTAHAAILYLLHGVTTIREAGDLDGTAVSAAQALADRGAIPVPRLLYCGPFVGAGKRKFRNTYLLESPDDAEAAVAEVKRRGASFVKFYDGLTESMIRALEAICQREGMGMMGHVPAALTYEKARVQEVQHFFGVPAPDALSPRTLLNRFCQWSTVDRARMEEIVEFSLAHGIHNTPTIEPLRAMLGYRDFEEAVASGEGGWMPPMFNDVLWRPENTLFNKALAGDYLDREVVPAIEKKQQLTKMLVDAGAAVYLGTDVMQPFVCPGQALQREMEAFVDAGIPPERVWQLATSVAGQRLKIPKLGQLVAGAPADILIFSQDPTTSLTHLKSLKAVIRGGRLYDIRALQETMNATLAFYRSPLIRRLAKTGAKQALAKARG